METTQAVTAGVAMSAESSWRHGSASTPWLTNTILGTQLTDTRPAVSQPPGSGRQARSGAGLGWGGTSLRMELESRFSILN